MAFNKVRYSARQYALEDIVGEPEEQEELSEEETMPTYEEEEGTVSPVEVYEDAQDEVVEQTEAMEALYATVQEFQAEGGMSPQTAVVVQMCMENILGAYAENVNMPALESFAEVGGRATATAYALEGIWENIKKWFQKMIASVVAWATKIKNWIVERVNRANRIKVQAVSLKKKMGEVKAYTHKNDQLELSPALYNFITNTDSRGVAGGLKHIREGMEATKKIDKSDEGYLEQFKIAVKALMMSGDAPYHPQSLGTVQEVGAMLSSVNGIAFNKFPNRVTNGEYYESKPFLGEKKLVIIIHGDSEGKFISSTITQKPNQDSEGVRKGTEKVKVMPPAEIITLLDEIILTCDAVTRDKVDGSKYDKRVSEVKKLGDELLKTLKELEDKEPEKAKEAKKFIYAIPNMSKAVNSGRRAMTAIALSAILGSWEYAVKSASLVKKNKE